jgi:hypothetical protein
MGRLIGEEGGGIAISGDAESAEDLDFCWLAERETDADRSVAGDGFGVFLFPSAPFASSAVLTSFVFF